MLERISAWGGYLPLYMAMFIPEELPKSMTFQVDLSALGEIPAE